MSNVFVQRVILVMIAQRESVHQRDAQDMASVHQRLAFVRVTEDTRERDARDLSVNMTVVQTASAMARRRNVIIQVE